MSNSDGVQMPTGPREIGYLREFRHYACQNISNGERGVGFMTAHRHALLAGDFDEPCDHGVRLMECGKADCIDLYDRIVSSYLERAS